VIDSVLWVGGLIVAILLAVSRFARGVDKKAPQPAQNPPEPVGAIHAREVIETALSEETEAIKQAREGDDPAGDLAALANMASRARK
tara:strand:- start:542 stop:802 length:261 start_codon:yes stop_codon:yes gene_type:complete